jgi:hypothetical protein
VHLLGGYRHRWHGRCPCCRRATRSVRSAEELHVRRAMFPPLGAPRIVKRAFVQARSVGAPCTGGRHRAQPRWIAAVIIGWAGRMTATRPDDRLAPALPR